MADGGGQAEHAAAGGGAEGLAAFIDPRPPVIAAAARGDLAALDALLAAGADTEARDEVHGSTPFLWACDEGQLECAQALAAAGCDVAAADSKGNCTKCMVHLQGP